MEAKRGYTRQFRPKGAPQGEHGRRGKRYLLDAIPAGLWTKVRDRAKRDGISLRGLILTLLTLWLEGDIKLPKEKAA